MPRWRRKQLRRARRQPPLTEADRIQQVRRLEAHLPAGDKSWRCGCPKLHPEMRVRCKKCGERNPLRRKTAHV